MRDFMFGILFHLICTIKESLKSYFHLSSGHTMLFYLNLIFNQLAQVNRLESILEVLTMIVPNGTNKMTRPPVVRMMVGSVIGSK